MKVWVMALRYQIIQTHQEFRDLNVEWNRLLSQSRSNTVFLTWEWQFTWWESFGHDLYIVLIFQSRCLIAILPFVKTRTMFIDSLKFIGADIYSDYLDFIIKESFEKQVLDFFLKEFLKEHQHIGRLELDNINERSPNLQYLSNSFPIGGFDLKLKEARICPYISLPESWATYLSALSSHRRYAIKRNVKMMKKNFNVKVGVASTRDEIQRRLKHFMDLHQLRMNQLQRSGAFSEAAAVDFHKKLSARFFEKGYLKLYYLELDDAPVASLYLFKYHDAILFYLGGFDPDLRYYRYSPSSFLLGRAVADAIADGMNEFDFLRGEGEYKFRWSRKIRTNRSFSIEKRTPMLKFFFGLIQIKNRVVQFLPLKRRLFFRL